MPDKDRIELTGMAQVPLALDRAELARFPATAQVANVSALVPGRAGKAVRLAALLERARPAPDAAFLDIASTDPAFAVSLPLDEVRGALILYELEGAALPVGKGGPFRLLVPGHADECVHVKALARIELAHARGRDTRPADDEAHRALHAARKKS